MANDAQLSSEWSRAITEASKSAQLFTDLYKTVQRVGGVVLFDEGELLFKKGAGKRVQLAKQLMQTDDTRALVFVTTNQVRTTARIPHVRPCRRPHTRRARGSPRTSTSTCCAASRSACTSACPTAPRAARCSSSSSAS